MAREGQFLLYSLLQSITMPQCKVLVYLACLWLFAILLTSTVSRASPGLAEGINAVRIAAVIRVLTSIQMR